MSPETSVKTEISETPMETLLKTVISPPEGIDRTEEEQLQKDIEEFKRKRRGIAEINIRNFLPVHRSDMEQAKQSKISLLDETIRENEKKMRGVQFRNKCRQKHMDMAENGYPNLIDMSFLGSSQEDHRSPNKEKKIPAFVVTPIDNSSGKVRVAIGSKRLRWSNLPEEYANFYPDLPKGISSIFKNGFDPFGETIEIKGMPPTWAREAIDNASRSKLFDQIFMIAEITKVTLGVLSNGEADKGVVVAGYVGETNQLYLITSYESIPSKEHIDSLLATNQ